MDNEISKVLELINSLIENENITLKCFESLNKRIQALESKVDELPPW